MAAFPKGLHRLLQIIQFDYHYLYYINFLVTTPQNIHYTLANVAYVYTT